MICFILFYSRLADRQGATERKNLLKPLKLQKGPSTAKSPLPAAKALPSQHTPTGQPPIEFDVKDSTAGQSPVRKRRARPRVTSGRDVTTTASVIPTTSPATAAPSAVQGPMGFPMWPMWPGQMAMNMGFPAPAPAAASTTTPTMTDTTMPATTVGGQGPGVWPQWPMCPPWYCWPPTMSAPPVTLPQQGSVTSSSTATAAAARQRAHRQRKKEQEDSERMAKGLSPRKRYVKKSAGYMCRLCNKPKTAAFNHTQESGQWYCPKMGDIEAWRRTIKPRRKRQPRAKHDTEKKDEDEDPTSQN